jgi:hypothetical protein
MFSSLLFRFTSINGFYPPLFLSKSGSIHAQKPLRNCTFMNSTSWDCIFIFIISRGWIQRKNMVYGTPILKYNLNINIQYICSVLWKRQFFFLCDPGGGGGGECRHTAPDKKKKLAKGKALPRVYLRLCPKLKLLKN